MKNDKPQKALAALGARLVGAQGNLTEARKAARKVLPFLPTPSVRDHIALPEDLPLPATVLFEPSPKSSVIESPRIVFDQFPPVNPMELPDEWMTAFLKYVPRLQRGAWLAECYSSCSRFLREGGDRPDLSRVDGMVAGLLFLLLHPPIGSPLREQLFKRAGAHKFGTFLAAQDMLLDQEQLTILMLLGMDSRFLLWLSQLPGWQEECRKYGSRHHDLHGGLLMLPSSLGEVWLKNLIAQSFDRPEAASASLILQPNAPERLRTLWIESVKREESGRLPYLTTRFAQHSWEVQEWKRLRGQFQESATADRGQWWSHWFMHCAEPQEALAALADPGSDLLWCLELLHAIRGPDKAVRHRLGQRLGTSPLDNEAFAALHWLNLRQQNHTSPCKP